MINRPVTERDLRMPEFQNVEPDELEFRKDGKIVRKDRWERGMFRIAHALGFNSRDGFEIDDVAAKVEELGRKDQAEWLLVSDTEPDDLTEWAVVDIELPDGSVLRNATVHVSSEDKVGWNWGSTLFPFDNVTRWKDAEVSDD